MAHRRWLVLVLVTALIVTGLPPLPWLRHRAPDAIASPSPTTSRVSVSSSGVQGNGHSRNPSVSDDGRYVAFESTASNLVAGDTNGLSDIFVRDLRLGTTTRVSVASNGSQGNNFSSDPWISPEGRFIAFESRATNLVATDTNDFIDIFLHDQLNHSTQRVSLTSTGDQSNADSFDPVVSLNGNYVAFASTAKNLVPNHGLNWFDVFVRSVATGDTTLVSANTQGQAGNGNSTAPSITGDGSRVAFRSGATNLVPADTNGWDDVFMREGTAGGVTNITNGGNGSSGFAPAISEDGIHVAFVSDANNFVAGDTNGVRDVFVRHMNGIGVQRASVSSSEDQANTASTFPPAISARGRYIAYQSSASNLVASDTNGADDIFLRDENAGATNRISISSGGVQSNGSSSLPAISADGRYVAFESAASNLVTGDTNGSADVFVRDLATTVVPDGQTLGRGLHGSNPTDYWADPVNTATGSFTHVAVDLALPGIGVPFVLNRSYNSGDSLIGELGRGWTHSYAVSLTAQWNGDQLLRGEDGQQLVFTRLANGSYAPPPGGQSVLTAIEGGHELTRKDQVIYGFDSQGRVTRIRDRNDEGLTLNYDASGLASITDGAGRQINFSHSGGRLTEIELPDGRSVSYGYTNGLLTSFTDSRGKTTTYAYDSGGRLTQITDPNGNYEVRNTYGSDGRVTDQLDALGNRSTFAWDPTTQTATLTDAQNRVWKDVYSDNVLIQRIDPLGNDVDLQVDSNLNLSQVSDPLNKDWILSFDSRGNLLSRAAPSPLSFAESWTYDSKNNPLTYTDARNKTWTYEYDASGRLTKQTDPNSNFQSFTYTANGQVATVSDFRGHTTTYTYDPQGNVTQIESPLGRKTTYSYDAAGRVVSMVDPRGNETGADPNDYKSTYTYDAAGHLLTETDPLGNVTAYSYDDVGNLETVTDALNRVTRYTYNDANEVVSEEAPGGRTTSHEYDERGNLIARTEPGDRKTTYTYDAAGRVTSMVVPRGNAPGANPDDFRWSYQYNAAGLLTRITNPLDGTIDYTYDAAGRRLSTTDERGKTTTFAYDANGNRTSMTAPLNAVTSYTYDNLSRLSTITDPRGKTTTYQYDANGNRTATITPLGNKRTFAYDDANRLASTVEPRGNIVGADPNDYRWTYSYDAADNRTSETDPLGNETEWQYDRAGRLTKRIDALNHATSYIYDAINRMTTVKAADNGETTYAYNPAGDLVTRTDALNHATTYDYDSAGRLSGKTSPIGQAWTYSYDAGDNLTKIVDAAGNGTSGDPDDGTTIRTFDELNRLTGINYSDSTPDVTFSYDAAGNRTGMTDGQGSATYSYDDRGRLTQLARGTSVLSYEYDLASNITRRTYPDGTEVNLTYDDDSQINTVTQGSTVTDYSFDPAGNVTTVDNANGTQETRLYDRAGRLSEIRHRTAGASFDFATYTRDAVGNPTRIETRDGNISSDYDELDRLTESCFTADCAGIAPDGGDAFVRYTYDSVGNRLTESRPIGTTTYAYDAADELTQSQGPTGTTTFEYDADGNETHAGTTTLAFDLAGRLTSVAGATGTTTYDYDGDGRRARDTQTSVLPPAITNYVWDTNGNLPELVLERGAVGDLLHRYVYGENLITTTSRDPLNPAQTQTQTHHADAIGSTTTLTDSDGNIDWRYSYDPYGGPRRQAHDDLGSADTAMRFAGARLDKETGLYHLRARQYDTTIGRFLSVDPVERGAADPSVSAYAYADDKPTLLTDPSGERGQSTIQRGFVPGPVAPPIRIPAPAPPEPLPPAVPCFNPACVVGIGVGLGILIYKLDPFNYTQPVEEFGGDLYDWFTGDDEEETRRFLWRAGPDEPWTYTPRPIREGYQNDVEGWPLNGVSVWTTKLAACKASPGSKSVQELAPAVLTKIPNLLIVPDPSLPGHRFLAASTLQLHEEWAATRPGLVARTGLPNPLTTAVRFARVGHLSC
jgi:RHS repeat-associated protein